ncbi:MAG: hypothetical protein QOJ13_1348 [Gaiellales bacterium]|jgi:hypothetical protein|nr:hypothetical protein [Gaiellales bacterium]
MNEQAREDTVFVELEVPPEFKKDGASVFASYIPVANDETESLLYEPLELLRANVRNVDLSGDWRISVTRDNAQFSVPRLPTRGPRHHLCLWLVAAEARTVHLLMHRAQPPEA